MAITDLVKPLITEKTMRLAEAGQFTFMVQPSANQAAVKQAVEQLFAVNVINVNLCRLPRKTRRSGKKRLLNISPFRKKAVVSLKSGQTIDYFQSPEKKKTSAKPKSTVTAPVKKQATAKKKGGLRSLFSRQKTV